MQDCAVHGDMRPIAGKLIFRASAMRIAQVLQRVPHAMFEGAAARVQKRSAALSLEELTEYKARRPCPFCLMQVT